MKGYPGLQNLVFKKIFCNCENIKMLQEFFKRIFKTDVEVIDFKNEEMTDKFFCFLIKIRNEMVHVGLGIYCNDYMRSRNYACFSEIYYNSIKTSEKYLSEERFVYIGLIYGLKNKNEYKEYCLMNYDGTKFIENFEVIEFNMDALMEYWFKKDSQKIAEYKHLIMLCLNDGELSTFGIGDEFIEKYRMELNKLAQDEDFNFLRQLTIEWQRIANTEKCLGEKVGMARGIEQSAVAFLKNGIAIAKVSEITGISMKKLRRLLSQK